MLQMVVVNAPHNPTGWLPSHEEWREIVDACRAAGTHLFSDEMYRMLELEPADRLAPACELYDRAVTLSGHLPLASSCLSLTLSFMTVLLSTDQW